MTRSTLIILLAFGWAAPPNQARAQPRDSYQKRARPTLVWALAELERIQGMSSGCVDGQKIRQRLKRVRRQLGYLVPGNKGTAPTPARPVVKAISPGNFARLLGAVRSQRFSQGKVRAIRQAAARNRFTCRQVAVLTRAFSLTDYKLKVLRLVARRISDRQNAAVIYGAFPQKGDRRKAQIILFSKRW